MAVDPDGIAVRIVPAVGFWVICCAVGLDDVGDEEVGGAVGLVVGAIVAIGEAVGEAVGAVDTLVGESVMGGEGVGEVIVTATMFEPVTSP